MRETMKIGQPNQSAAFPSHGRGRRFNPYSAHHFGNETAMKRLRFIKRRRNLDQSCRCRRLMLEVLTIKKISMHFVLLLDSGYSISSPTLSKFQYRCDRSPAPMSDGTGRPAGVTCLNAWII
jgi:hypothetical protein